MRTSMAIKIFVGLSLHTQINDDNDNLLMQEYTTRSLMCFVCLNWQRCKLYGIAHLFRKLVGTTQLGLLETANVHVLMV